MDVFKQLLESGVISEETHSAISTAWASKIQENRDQVTAELREEFAQRYNHDKAVMAEALDKMVRDRLEVELAELAEDHKGLREAKVAYSKKMKEDSKKMEDFMLRQLTKEIAEFASDRQKVAENFTKLEKFIVHALSKEIAEFAQDKRDLAETKVKLVKEARVQFDKVKADFIKKNAQVVKESVTRLLKQELKQLKEDIDQARNNSFGRRLFEAFSQEYAESYLNEKSETSKLMRIVRERDLALAEAKSQLIEKDQLLENKEREVRVQRDLAERQRLLSEMLAPLGAEQKGVMKQLLESVRTAKLRDAFDKYLPAVMEGAVVKPKTEKSSLTESAEITGDRKAKPEVGLDNIVEIRKLAGLK